MRFEQASLLSSRRGARVQRPASSPHSSSHPRPVRSPRNRPTPAAPRSRRTAPAVTARISWDIRRSPAPAFIGGWSTRNTRDLFGLIQTTMPTDRPGALPADTYVNIVAFILQSNGRTPGTQPLTATTSVPIGAPAQRARGAQPAQAAQAAQAPAPAPAGRGAGAARWRAGGGRGQPQAPVVGLTVAGEVKNFARVTDEMLKNPPPGDWLDAPARSLRVELQPADADHARQRAGPAAGVGLRR